MVERDEAIELAAQIAASMGIRTKQLRRLRLVGAGEQHHTGMSALQRDTAYRRAQDIVSMYGLGWLVRQESMHVNGIMECLSDDELVALGEKLDRAVEAIMDGVPFAEVGLLKGVTCNWVA